MPNRTFHPNHLPTWLTRHWRITLLGAILSGPALCVHGQDLTSSQSAGAAAAPPPAAVPVAVPVSARPAIGLLLPLDASGFAAPAQAVQKGCEAALAFDGGQTALLVTRTDADPAGTLAAWTATAGRGAAVIVGPLTRNAVSTLAAGLARSPLNRETFPASATGGRLAAPPVTLTLNAPEDATSLPPRFHTFGLVIEQEARAVARLAWSDGHRNAYVVQTAGALERRASQAFAREWLALGGRIADSDDFQPGMDAARFKARMNRSDVDMVFLGADAAGARTIRPYLAIQLPVYTTSQVNDGRLDAGANVDLTGLRFVDMPWLMQPDHPAVMVYPRPDFNSPELQRFYALGIDACRLATALLGGASRIDIDGVTGRLQLAVNAGSAGTSVQREPFSAMFADPAALPPPVAAAHEAAVPGQAPLP